MNSLAPMPPTKWKPSWASATAATGGAGTTSSVVEAIPLLAGETSKVAFTNVPPTRPRGSGYNSMRTRTRRIRRNIPIQPFTYDFKHKGTAASAILFAPNMNITNIPPMTHEIKANTYYTMEELKSMKKDMKEQSIKDVEIVLKLYFDNHKIPYEDIHIVRGKAVPFYEFYWAYYPVALRWMSKHGNVPAAHWAAKPSINVGKNISANINALANKIKGKGTAVPNMKGKFRRTRRRN